MNKHKIELIEPVKGFTEREKHSKAILNTDTQGLLRYKIQRQKMMEAGRTTKEMISVKEEVNSIRNDLNDIKKLLSQIINNTDFTK